MSTLSTPFLFVSDILLLAGGGFPGWLTNIADVGRTADPGYIAAFQNYVKTFSAITHKYQYPDGPVIGKTIVSI